MKNFTFILLLLFSYSANSQSIFVTKQDVVEYLEGDWTLDVVTGGFSGGPHFLPTPFYFDSTVHIVTFEATGNEDTPLLCKSYISDTLYQERLVGVQMNPSQILLPRWLLSNLPNNLEIDSGLAEEQGFYGFSQDTIVLLGDIAADGLQYGLSRKTSSSVNESLENSQNYNVYPNPGRGMITIDGIDRDVAFKVFNIDGRIVQQGMTINRSLEVKHNGQLILQFKVNNQWVSKKLFLIE